MAVTFKRHDVIQLLIDHGADLELAVADGWTALFVAVKVNDTSAAKLLLEHGANVNHGKTTVKQRCSWLSNIDTKIWLSC